MQKIQLFYVKGRTIFILLLEVGLIVERRIGTDADVKIHRLFYSGPPTAQNYLTIRFLALPWFQSFVFHVCTTEIITRYHILSIQIHLSPFPWDPIHAYHLPIICPLAEIHNIFRRLFFHFFFFLLHVSFEYLYPVVTTLTISYHLLSFSFSLFFFFFFLYFFKWQFALYNVSLKLICFLYERKKKKTIFNHSPRDLFLTLPTFVMERGLFSSSPSRTPTFLQHYLSL